MAYRYEIRLSGSGGQGMILAGVILAEAAAIYDGKNATQTQSYGPEARGGASKSEVIISDGDIDYPKATNVDLLLALTQEACDKYYSALKEGGILIVDSELVQNIPPVKAKVYKLPITAIAREKVGKSIVANIVALGALVEASKIVSFKALQEAVLNRVPRGTEEVNLRALQEGVNAIKEYKPE